MVTVDDDQVEPQPHLTPVRSAQEPLRGAVITGFQTIGKNNYALEYTLDGTKSYVNYQLEGSTYTFEFVDAADHRRTETYRQD